MLKLFKRKNTNINFFEETKKEPIGIFKTWSKNNINNSSEFELYEEDRNRIGAYICCAKADNKDYNVIWY